jgi:PPM family protein phosphatase
MRKEKRGSMEIQYGSAIDVGLKRSGKPNQDAFVILNSKHDNTLPPVLIVADGMGGYKGGEVASQIVIQQFSEDYAASNGKSFSMAAYSEQAIRKAILKMQEKAKEDVEYASMGSTVVALSLINARVNVVNVGDSRAYLINTNGVRQISYDHSFVGEAMRAGLLTAEEAMHHPKKNQLTQSIRAAATEIRPYYGTETLANNDYILLCSDGLWGVVPEPMIHYVVTANPPQMAAELLVQAANNLGGPDNISVIIARPVQDGPITKPAIRVQKADATSTLIQSR